MRKSQPLDLSKEQLARLGIREETEEQRAAGERVVKVETVAEMFDFDFHPTMLSKLLRPFRRLKRQMVETKRWVKNSFVFRQELTEYYPWSINAFLPLFIKHLELYIDREKRFGITTKEFKEYKISTAQEALDILKRLLADDYISPYTDAIEGKWGKFPYEKTTYADRSTGFRHLTPDGYDADRTAAYEKGMADQESDLKQLGELIEKNMLDWWD